MALQASAQKAQFRRTAEFHPSVWEDYFINKVSQDEGKQLLMQMLVSSWTEQVEVLKEEVSTLLRNATDEPSQKLNLIDVVLRLGIGYHFEGEINEALEQAYNTYHDHNFEEDLFTAALRFRLLRECGYDVSSDIFNKFKDGNGNFNENLKDDAKGLLSLYEASFLSVHGEDILDEALSFSKIELESIVTKSASPLGDQVSHALKWPLHRDVPKHEQWHFISLYQRDEARTDSVLKLAKLNFNILQKSYQKELKILSEWWIDLDFATKLPFARDRIVECYFWALGAFSEPEFVRARRFLTKIAILVSIIDDIYDVHGKMWELELFTKMIERWDITSAEDVPDYMKLCFKALIDIMNEIEEETTKEGRPYCVHYTKEAEKKIVRAYLAEARWFNEDNVPKLEEYRRVGLYTSANPLLSVTSLSGMGKIASKEVFEWLSSCPKILLASSDIGRLVDDIASHEFEQQRGHVASSVECCMKQYGVSKEEARDKLRKIVESAWKDMNEDLLKSTDAPKRILTVFLNLARVMYVMYKDDHDGYTVANSFVKEMLTALLVNPLPI